MNRGELNDLLTRYLKRTDLVDLYDDWVQFASNVIDQELRTPEQEYRSVTIPTEQFVSLPTDFIEMRHIEYNGCPLRFVTADQLDGMRALNLHGLQYYTIVDSQLELCPAPTADSTGTLEMFYYAKLPAIPTTGATNKVLTAYPQLYLYRCMIEASAFRLAAGDDQSYKALWTDYARTLNDRAQAGRFSGRLQMRIA
jgi:hypothetical protein